MLSLKDHLTKWWSNIIGRSPLRLITILSWFGGHRYFVSGDMFVYSLSYDLDVVTSPATTWLAWFESFPVDLLACQIWWSYIHDFLMESWSHRLDMPCWEIFIIRNSPLTILKSRTRLAETRRRAWGIAKH